MYAQVLRDNSSAVNRMVSALAEEPGFRGATRTPSGATRVQWESATSAHWPAHDFGGRLLTLYRASGRPA